MNTDYIRGINVWFSDKCMWYWQMRVYHLYVYYQIILSRIYIRNCSGLSLFAGKQ